jgi:ribosomal protein S2
MSSKLPVSLSATDEDITLLLSAQAHIGTKNCDKGMIPYVYKRRPDGALFIPFTYTLSPLQCLSVLL